MLDINTATIREGYVRYLPVGLLVAMVMLVEMIVLIGIRARSVTPFGDNVAMANGADAVPNTTWLAQALFTDFLLPFEVAAVILTIAVIAAVMLTLRRTVGAKHQDPAAQSRVRAGDRLRMVKMSAVRPRPASSDAVEESAK
jgi:NADH-quinone oxidoreductase subunit J